jgi:SAM-dependent MidA family methyltransferase
MQAEHSAALPEPDPAAAEHSRRVAAHLRESIAAAGGMIGFAQFMHEALYAPGLGYYSAGARKFGAAGDFVTAPEVSPLFGRVLARQCAPVLAAIHAADVLEFGAGSGRLAADVLAGLAKLGVLPREYRILEPSAELCERQCELLRRETPELVERVVWLDRLPADHSGVVIANEVVDAMPVERFRRTADGVLQACVRIEADGFAVCERPAGEALTAAVGAIEEDLGRPLPDGYVSEVCTAAPAWMADVADMLDRGFAFIFDYGVSRREYYAPGRNGGWLRCHFRQRAHNDPLILPGIQDITSWVDFSALADAASRAGLGVAGYVTQAHFLLHGGLEPELAGFAELPPGAQFELSAQVKTLTLPGEMGEHFKCLGLGRGVSATPAALAMHDRAASL